MLGRQAKVLTAAQIRAVLSHLEGTRHPLRNRAMFLLSVRAGLRAKEIAAVRWGMVTDAEGSLGTDLRLTNEASKGRSGGVIPMSKDLREALQGHRDQARHIAASDLIVTTERSPSTSAQVVINTFAGWYGALGFDGCSSHSGRRTFITNAARNIGRVGGSLRDVQALARHSSLSTTQRYIDVSADAMRRVVDFS